MQKVGKNNNAKIFSNKTFCNLGSVSLKYSMAEIAKDAASGMFKNEIEENFKKFRMNEIKGSTHARESDHTKAQIFMS